jgi:dienelactone hydrolase
VNKWVVALLMLGLVGCGEPAKEEKHEEKKPTPPPVEAPEEPPVSPHRAMREVAFEDLEIETPDGAKLIGRLYDPTQGLEEVPDPVPVSPLVILLHGINGNVHDWRTLPKELVDLGYAVVALDIRGHGKSTRQGNTLINWRRFKTNDWRGLPKDVEAVLRFFQTRTEDYPQVAVDQRVVVIGGSLGANIAILAAGSPTLPATPKETPLPKITDLVLLSPSMSLKGLSTELPMVKTHARTLMMASQADRLSFEPVQALYRLASGEKSLKIFKNVGHGTDMLMAPGLIQEILTWLKPAKAAPEKPATTDATAPHEAATGPEPPPAESHH